MRIRFVAKDPESVPDQSPTPLHLEMRDSYGTEAEIPHLAKWAAGEPDDLGWLKPWCTLIRDATVAGKAFRRVRIVSEPLSEYQRWGLQRHCSDG